MKCLNFHSMPAPTPHEETPTPTPAPTPAPQQTKKAPLAPGCIFYVQKRFSVNTADGIHAFSVGKKVTLVREEGEELVVSDGSVEGTAPKDSFTNDPATIAQINSKLTAAANKNYAEIAQKQVESKKSLQASEVERARLVKEQKINELRRQIDALSQQRDEIRQALARAPRGTYYYDYNGVKHNEDYNQVRHSKITNVSSINSPENDARREQLKAIEQNMRALQNQIAEVERR